MAVSLVTLLAAVGLHAVGTGADAGTGAAGTGADVVLPSLARSSFAFNSSDRPLSRFPLRNCTALLLSGDRLYVGARDGVFSLDATDVMVPRGQASWPPGKSDVSTCEMKRKNATADCANFVGVLQRLNASHLYACGSFAFNPHESFLDAETLAMTPPRASKGRCPFSPFERSAAVVADGELFTATTVDFFGVRPFIMRHFSKDGRPDLSQESLSMLLDEPDFVASALDSVQRKVFFFFSEVAKEFNVQQDMRVARVASVCQDDVGGARVLQKKWTTLVKSTLSCLQPFNVLLDVFSHPPAEGQDPQETRFYAIFVSQWSLRPESVVCSFSLASLRAVFEGPYRIVDADTQRWSTSVTRSSFGQCNINSSSHAKLEEVKRTFLTDGSVAPEEGGPLLVSIHQRYSRLAVTRARGADGRSHPVLFLLTENGLLHKAFISARGPRLVEEVAVLDRAGRVTAFALSPAKGVMFVGSWGGVTAVPVARCSAHATCGRCLFARDPFCGWSQSARRCLQLDREHQRPQDTPQGDDLFQLLEGGDVRNVCPGDHVDPPVKNVVAGAGEVVKLSCYKPWASSTLTWRRSPAGVLTGRGFIWSDDGGLNFLASQNTWGGYRCEAEEDGYTETVASYCVFPPSGRRLACPDAEPVLAEPVPAEPDPAEPVPAEPSSPPAAPVPAEPDPAEPVPAEPSSPLSARCERRSHYGWLVGVAVCICVLLAAISAACVRRKPDAGRVIPLHAEVDRREGRVPEMGVELEEKLKSDT
ncbi:semaphorin-4A-like [Stigmatopora argus]